MALTANGDYRKRGCGTIKVATRKLCLGVSTHRDERFPIRRAQLFGDEQARWFENMFVPIDTIIKINLNNTYGFIASAQNLLSTVAIIFYDYFLTWKLICRSVRKLNIFLGEQSDGNRIEIKLRTNWLTRAASVAIMGTIHSVTLLQHRKV